MSETLKLVETRTIPAVMDSWGAHHGHVSLCQITMMKTLDMRSISLEIVVCYCPTRYPLRDTK